MCCVVSCRVVSCRVVSCRVVSCRVVSCRVVSCRVVSCRVVSCRVVSCRVVSCRVVSCRAVPCRAVPCRVVLCCCVYGYKNTGGHNFPKDKDKCKFWVIALRRTESDGTLCRPTANSVVCKANFKITDYKTNSFIGMHTMSSISY